MYAKVIKKNRCTVCGACVGFCPYFSYLEGKVVMTDRCTLEAGRCFDFCPMAGAMGRFEGELGRFREIFVARAVDPDMLKKAQYGGVVSMLTALALEQGLVQEAVLASGHPERPPHGVLVRTREEVLASAGSRYTAAGVVAALNEELAGPGIHPLGLVGTPCQIKAAAAMRAADPEEVPFDPGRIKLLIGLFCTWALDYRRFSVYLRYMLFGERAFRYDIPPPPAQVFKVYTGDGIKAFPLEEIRDMRLNACRFCDDLTSVMADVSVGAVEGLDGWNTIIVRTQAGAELIELALKKQLLEVDHYPADDLENLKDAARQKKERSILAWKGEG